MHASLQHTPSAQKPDVHSVAAAQGEPLGLPVHAPLTHLSPVAQSASDAQVVLHADVVASQMYGWHGVVVFGVHAPVFEQVDSLATDVVPTHAAAAQVVPAVVTLHAPMPSQTPSDEQVPVPMVPHSLSGSVPSLMFSQSPSTL